MDRKNKIQKAIVILICLVLLFGTNVVAQRKFQKHNISTLTRPMDVYAGDINGDGHVDFATVADISNGQVAWWKNDGQFNFTKYVLKSPFAGVRGVRIEDLDGDGNMDIIAAATEDDKILWWKNDGEENFTQLSIEENFVGAHTVEIRDMDDDGDMDVLCSGFDFDDKQGEAAWWSNDGEENFTKHLLSDRYQQSPFIFGEDMDSDGDMDVIACGELNNEICWYKNDGSENFTEYIIDDNNNRIHTIIARDFDKDGDMDILASATTGLFAWYENDGEQNFNRINIEQVGGAIWLDAVDIDEDGDNDLIGTAMGAGTLIWYENDGNSNLTRHNVEGSLTSGFALNIVDMDGDNDMDVIAIGLNSNTVAWFENLLDVPERLNNPESIVWDELNQRYMVSNKEDGDIIDISLEGYQKGFKNNLSYVTGMSICNNKLYVANGAQILGLNLDLGFSMENYRLDGSQEIKDIITAGTEILYATDNMAGRIFKINTSDQSSEVLVENGLNSPSGLIYEEGTNSLIVISGENNANILKVDLTDNSVSTLATTSFTSLNDIITDGDGNYFVSSPSDNSVYVYAGGFDNAPVLLSSDLDSPTGMYYNGTDNTIVVLNSGNNTMSVIPKVINGIENVLTNSGNDIKLYPNPFSNELTINFNSRDNQNVVIDVLKNNGQVLTNLFSSEISLGNYSIQWNGTDNNGQRLSQGMYIVRLSSEKKSIFKKVILMN